MSSQQTRITSAETTKRSAPAYDCGRCDRTGFKRWIEQHATGQLKTFCLGSWQVRSCSAVPPADQSVHMRGCHPDHVQGSLPAPGDACSGADVPVQRVFRWICRRRCGCVSETLESALADLVGGEHAIVVHESAENIGNYILCGDIGGPMMGDSDLVIGLAELNESGASGVALLHDNGDGTTDVNVYVTEAAADGMDDHDMGDMGSPDAEEGASDVTVEIKDFAYGDPIEIAVVPLLPHES